jgi:transglutaminase-like putative cysteine protease
VAGASSSVSPVYTQLPETVPDRVRRLGVRLTAGASSRTAATVAIERFLAGRATYRLDSPVPPAGVDAVDHFLFTARTGFCEQFASAEVVMLRAAGIPARLATGFSGGVAADDGLRTLRGEDAHAWVEVWHPGVGWVSSDPTAGATLADGHSLRSWIEQMLRNSRGRAIVAGLLVAAVLLGGGLVWLVTRWVRRRRLRWVPPVRQPVVAAFERLVDALARTGAPRATSESVRELAGRPGLAPVTRALEVVELTSYAARAPGPAETDAAVRDLDEMTRRLLADA